MPFYKYDGIGGVWAADTVMLPVHGDLAPEDCPLDGWVHADSAAAAVAALDALETGGVPAVVTMRQARLALLAAGYLSQVQAAIDSLPEPAKSAAQITWEYSQEVQRSNGLVSQMAPALGMTEAQIDALFIAAAQL